MIYISAFQNKTSQVFTDPVSFSTYPTITATSGLKEEADILKVASNNNENVDQYLKHLACRCEHVIYDIYASLVDCKVREFYRCIYVTALVSS